MITRVREGLIVFLHTSVLKMNAGISSEMMISIRRLEDVITTMKLLSVMKTSNPIIQMLYPTFNIMKGIVTCMSDYRQGFGLETRFIDNFNT
jgi:hypothetical protein